MVRAMRTIGLLVLTVVILSGCGGSSSSGDSSAAHGVPSAATTPTTSTASTNPTPTPTIAVTSSLHQRKAKLPKTVCAAFKDFYGDLSSTPPMGHQIGLVASVEVVGKVADRNPEAVSRRVFDDVQNLVAYVGATEFPSTGNILGRPVQRMVSDCF